MDAEIDRLNEALSGRYTIEREIGRGGMATVYAANDLRHSRRVAIKLIDRNIVSDVTASRFHREISIAARLQHPHIIALFDSGEADGRPFFAMPLVDGTTLRALIDREHQLPIADAIAFSIEIADALAYAHDEGVVHRDIKPENILLARYAKRDSAGERLHSLVSDFGIAKALSDDTGERLTGTGFVIGTATYMSPEQLTGGQDVDGRSDQYSLGCVLFEMLTGCAPFAGNVGMAAMAKRILDAPPSVRSFRSDVPEALAQVVGRMLSADPALRFPDGHNLGDALRALRNFSSTTAPAIASPATVSGTRRLRLFAAVALTAAAGTAYWSVRESTSNRGAVARPTATASKAPLSIAVLPFVGYDSAGTDEYIADGMTEELISALGKIPGLLVASRTASFALKGKTPSSQEIGKSLGVTAALEGSVRLMNGELRVSVQLVETATGHSRWKDEYVRPRSDILSVQEQIAKSVAGSLQLALSPTVEGQLARHQTNDPEAYRLYTLGRFFWNKRTALDHEKAIGFFTDAIKRDTMFALAYSGLADVKSMLAQNNPEPGALLRAARDAAANSVRLDSSRAEGYASVAIVEAFLEPRDTSTIFTNFRRAIALDSTYAPQLQWFAISLTASGEFDAAIARAQQALRLSPTGVSINQGYGLVLYMSGRMQEAEKQFRVTLTINPASASAQNRLAQTLAELGKFDEAIALARETNSRVPVEVQSRGTLGYVLARAGRTKEARAIAHSLHEQTGLKDPSDLYPAMIYAALGDKTESLVWLERGYERGATWLPLLAVDPAFRTMRADARFQRIEEQVAFPRNR